MPPQVCWRRASAVADPIGDLIQDGMLLEQLVPTGDAAVFEETSDVAIMTLYDLEASARCFY